MSCHHIILSCMDASPREIIGRAVVGFLIIGGYFVESKFFPFRVLLLQSEFLLLRVASYWRLDTSVRKAKLANTIEVVSLMKVAKKKCCTP